MERRIEAVARMATTGFIFDPEISMFQLFSPPAKDAYTPSQPSPAPAGPTRQTSLARGRSLTQQFRQMKRTLMRPFAMPSRQPATGYGLSSAQLRSASTPHINTNGTPAPTPSGISQRIKNAAHSVHQTIRDPTTPTFLSRAMRSDNNKDEIKLPFRLSIEHHHDKTQRNVPYLRQSWTRIDFIAVVSFWIMFVLAMTGVEKGKYHVGIFRALSVLRTARLLSMTSGTTVRPFFSSPFPC